VIANSSFSKIKKLADQISSGYDEKIIPLEKIGESEYLEIIYDNYEPGTFDGMTIFDDEEFYIHLNIDNGNRINSPRSRFTLAHEFGHYFIDTHRIGLKLGILEPHPSKIDKVQYDKIEREADYFAACLLMPEENFCKDLRSRKKFNFDVIEDLSREYHVSKTAFALRFAEIGNYPIKVVFAENGIIKWQKNSEGFPFWKLLNNGKVPEGMIMGDFFKGDRTDAFRTAEILAGDCFEQVRKHEARRVFYEHCLVHKNQALSIIWED